MVRVNDVDPFTPEKEREAQCGPGICPSRCSFHLPMRYVGVVIDGILDVTCSPHRADAHRIAVPIRVPNDGVDEVASVDQVSEVENSDRSSGAITLGGAETDG